MRFTLSILILTALPILTLTTIIYHLSEGSFPGNHNGLVLSELKTKN